MPAGPAGGSETVDHGIQPALFGSGWQTTKDGDLNGLALYRRHYSARRYRDGRRRRLFVGPGEKLVLILAPNADALFVWRRFRSEDTLARGVNCAVFRNESQARSSALILAAEERARARWPEEEWAHTYVDAGSIRSSNPGWCFQCAGWRKAGLTKDRGLVRLEKRLT